MLGSGQRGSARRNIKFYSVSKALPQLAVPRGNHNLSPLLSRAALLGLLAGVGFAVPAQADIMVDGDSGQVIAAGTTIAPGSPGSSWDIAGDLVVGVDNAGTGKLDITLGQVSSVNGKVGLGVDSTGVVTVAGPESSWENSSSLFVGVQGNGSLSITGGGQVSTVVGSMNRIVLGFNPGSTGTVTVDGEGSALNSGDYIYIGRSGGGRLELTNGGTATAVNNIDIGAEVGSTDIATVEGDGSLLKAGTDLTVGWHDSASGELHLRAGGKAEAAKIILGDEVATATGIVTVDGGGSLLKSLDYLDIGNSGTGTLTLTDGGTATAINSIHLGVNDGSTGTATVDGAGSLLQAGTNLVVGYDGTGELTLKNGGKAIAGTGIFLGYGDTGTGSGTLNIGDGGAAGIVNAPSVFGGISGGVVNFNHNATDTSPYFFTTTGNNSGTAVTLDGNLRVNNVAGYTVLTGVNGYTGGTWIENGATLALAGNGSIANSSAISFSNIGAFDISGTTTGASVKVLGSFSAADRILLGSKTLTLTDPFGGSIVSGVISGVGGGLTLATNAFAVLGGVNTYTGATTLDAGSELQLLFSGSIAASSGLAMASGATFDISPITAAGTSIGDLSGAGTVKLGTKVLTLGTANSTTFSGVIEGAGGGLTLNGGGELTLSGTNTYTGATTVTAGILALKDSGSIAASSGVLLATEGTFDISATTDGATIQTLNDTEAGQIGHVALGGKTLTIENGGEFGGVIADGGVGGGTGGGLALDGGTLTLSGANTYTGDTIINAGTLKVTGSLGEGDYAVAIINAGALVFDQDNAQTLSGNISGLGSLTKDGDGTLTLSGMNDDYAGDINLNAGRIDVGSNNALGNGDGAGVLTMAAGTTLGFAGDYAISNAITLAGAATVAVDDAAHTGQISGNISGTGTLTKDGAGTLILAGENNYTGATEVLAGTLALTGVGTISDTLALRNGTTFDVSASTATLNIATLNVYGSANWTGNLNMAGQTMNFYLSPTMGDGATALAVSGTANITGSTVNVGIPGSSTPLQPGNTVVLINAVSLTGAPGNSSSDNKWLIGQGATIDYTFDLSTTDKQLVATISSAKASEESKSLSEGFISGPGLVNQTSDLLADKGVAQAMEATGGGNGNKRGRTTMVGGYGLGSFGAISGGWNRYNTGSNADISSMSLMAGLAWGNDLEPGRLTLAGFLEYGNGSYDTYNSFANAPDARGSGNIYHLGGGILGRLDLSENATGNFYTEASARVGSVHNDYKNGNLGGFAVSYETDSAYYGLHAGAGYILNLDEKMSVDFYGKYFWTRQNGDSVHLATGDPIRFDSVDSHRLRAGGRFNYAVNAYIAPYAGLAYEYEFDGKAAATAYDQSIPAPSLQGGTGIGELGLTVKGNKNMPLSIDLGVQGYVGTREGVTGSLQVRYEF